MGGLAVAGSRAVRDDRTLPPTSRISSAITAVLLALLAVVILARGTVRKSV